MSREADGWGEDELDLGRAEGGCGNELLGKVEACASADERVFISDVKADVPIGDFGDDGFEIERLDDGVVFKGVKFFRFGEFGERGVLEDEAEALFAGCEVRCDEASARKACDGELIGFDEVLTDGPIDGALRLIEKWAEAIDPFRNVFGPKGERFGWTEPFFMCGEREGEKADPALGKELNRLVVGIFAKRVGAGKGEVKDCGQWAAVERGARVVQSYAVCVKLRRSDLGSHVAVLFVFSAVGDVRVVLAMGGGFGRSSLRSKGCKKGAGRVESRRGF